MEEPSGRNKDVYAIVPANDFPQSQPEYLFIKNELSGIG
jgi:hypothetical protein